MSDCAAIETNPEEAAKERSEICDREFERYYKERDEWIKAQLEAERSYDALLVTISTLALGASLAKPPVVEAGSFSHVVLIIGWFAFVVCLLTSLAHRYLSYDTHKRWIDVVDAEFRNWAPGALPRAEAKYDSIPFIRFVEKLKLIAGIAVAFGVLLLMCFLMANSTALAPQAPSVAPTYSPVININAPDVTGAMPATTQAVKP